MAVLKDMASSLTGNVNSALLIVYDCRSLAPVASSVFSGIGPLSKADMAINKFTQSVLTNGAAASNFAAAASSTKTFRVQFNPAELQMDAMVDVIDRMGAQNTDEDGQKVNTISDTVTAPKIELSMTLIFDQVNIYDAFMWDKATMGVSASGVTNAVSAGMAGLKGKVWTVQTEVEGLLAALRNPYTRKITFQWADFSFSGSLEHVNAKYTMFSVSGRPIRANVFLRLQQDQSMDEISKWESDFYKMFKEGDAELNGIDQTVGNLLNLGTGL